MKILPPDFESRMKSFPGFDFPAYTEELNRSPVKSFRINTDKISVSDFEAINVFGKTRIPYVDNGYYLDYEKAGNHPFHHAGLIYIQEPAAMAPAECIDIEPDWIILDMCAAPGGKSTQLKNKLGPNGVIVSNEIVSSRCRILTGNIERLGLSNAVTTCMDTKRLSKYFRNSFDLIMCDAPCSGEGMFRKDDTAIEEWSIDNVKLCASRQLEILENALELLKPGGIIIYATCTFSLEENEMLVDSFLKKHDSFKLLDVKKEVKDNTVPGICFEGSSADLSLTRRFYPYVSKGEGQFMAVLKNTEPCFSESVLPHPKPEKIDRLVQDFLNDTLEEYPTEELTIYNGTPVIYNGRLNIHDGSAFSCGITIGEIKKNYIQPHHQFFMAMGHLFKRKIDFPADSTEIKKYLHGEEIDVNCPNGWAVITVNGYPLGGVKVVNSKAKNHYPKGLRLKNI